MDVFEWVALWARRRNTPDFCVFERCDNLVICGSRVGGFPF